MKLGGEFVWVYSLIVIIINCIWGKFLSKKGTLSLQLRTEEPPSSFFKKSWFPLFCPPPTLLEILSPPLFTDPFSKMQKSSSPPSETFKLLLLGCQYDHTIVRRNTH